MANIGKVLVIRHINGLHCADFLDPNSASIQPPLRLSLTSVCFISGGC